MDESRTFIVHKRGHVTAAESRQFKFWRAPPMAIQAQLVEKTPAGFAEAVAESMLRAMGMSATDARAIARLPVRL